MEFNSLHKTIKQCRLKINIVALGGDIFLLLFLNLFNILCLLLFDYYCNNCCKRNFTWHFLIEEKNHEARFLSFSFMKYLTNIIIFLIWYFMVVCQIITKNLQWANFQSISSSRENWFCFIDFQRNKCSLVLTASPAKVPSVISH